MNSVFVTRIPLTRVLLTTCLAWVSGVMAVAVASSWPSQVVAPSDASELARLLDPAIGTACEGDAAEVEIAGVGRAQFAEITFETASGTGRLAGAVCIDLVSTETRLRTTAIDLAGLVLDEGAALRPTLRSEIAALDVGDWRVWVASIEGTLDALKFGHVVLIGPGAIGVAAGGALRDGVPVLQEVALVTDGYLLEADEARFDGVTVRLDGVQASPCVCREGSLSIMGAVADVALTGASASGTIRQPRMALLGATVPLGGTITLGRDGVAFDLPFTVRQDADLGTLVGIRATGLDDVTFAWGVAWQPRFGPWITTRFEDEVNRFDLRADGTGFTTSYRGSWGALAGAEWTGYVDVDVVGAQHDVQAGTQLRRPYAWRLADTDVRVEGALTVDAMTLLDADDDQGLLTAGYVPVSVDGTLRAEPLDGVTVQVTGDAEGGPLTWREANRETRSAFIARWSVIPSITVEQDAWRGTIGFSRQSVVGDPPPRGPIDVNAQARLQARGSWVGATSNVELDVAWRVPPETSGAERVRLRASATLPAWQDVRVRTAAEVRLAGLWGGDADDAFVRAGVATSMRDAWRVGVDAKVALPDAALTSLAVAMRYPFTSTMGAWMVTVTPSLTIETASIWRDVQPLSSHGLRIAVTECCATLFAAYEASEGDWSIDVGIDLPPFRLVGAPSRALPNVSALYGDER